jgi:hypothetical protein
MAQPGAAAVRIITGGPEVDFANVGFGPILLKKSVNNSR